MGMYTELVLKAQVNYHLDPLVEAVLQFLFNGGNLPEQLPEHPFFSCGRWQMIGRCSSYYHVPWSTSRYADGYIFSRSDLKDYEGEIEKFIDWLKPHLSHIPDDCIGWQWYEEDLEPTLITI